MKIGTYNIQNLFHRDKSLIEKPMGKCMTDWIQELDTLMRKSSNSHNEQDRIRELSFLIGFEKTINRPYAVLRRKAGYLYMKGLPHSTETRATDLTNWNGWIELQTVPVDPKAIENKARVITETNADILLLQEIEDRVSLEEFNQELLPKFGCDPYSRSFVIQGVDMRGCEMGILLRKGYSLRALTTHTLNSNIHCIEYEVMTPIQNIIWILAAHLQEQGKDKEHTDVIRRKQAEDIAEIYKNLIANGKKNIIIAGTLNAVSYCHSLAPLLQTDLKDITKHTFFNVDFDKGEDASYFRLGAYRLGVNIKQKDYLLLSPSLFKNVKESGLNRKGIWPEKRPQWSIYKTVTSKHLEASEHPLVWGKIDL